MKIFRYIASGARVFAAQPVFFLLGGLLCYLPLFASQFYLEEGKLKFWLDSLPLLYWQLIVSAGLSLAALKALGGEKPDNRELFSGFSRLGDLLGYLLILFAVNQLNGKGLEKYLNPKLPAHTLALAGLFVLYLVVFVGLMFTLYLMMEKKLSWWRAAGESLRLILPRWFALFFLFVICISPYLLLGVWLKHQGADLQSRSAPLLAYGLQVLLQPLKICIVAAAYRDIA